MQTKITNDIEKCAKEILDGGVVAIPTETVYGLAANAFDDIAISKIYQIKGRPSDNPLIVHISDIKQLKSLVISINDTAKTLIDKFWPGPLTLIFKKSDKISNIISSGMDTVAIRMPSHPVAKNFIDACNCPIVAPSANTSGKPSPTNAKHVLHDLNTKIPYILNGGDCDFGLESTVIDTTGDIARLLRAGIINDFGDIDIIIDKSIFQDIEITDKVSSPGMKYKHYAPNANVTVFCGNHEKTAYHIKKICNNNIGIICFDEHRVLFQDNITFCLGKSNDYSMQAHNLFSALRFFDDKNITEIYTQCPPDTGIGMAISNRLKKASGFNIINI